MSAPYSCVAAAVTDVDTAIPILLHTELHLAAIVAVGEDASEHYKTYC